VIDSCFCIVVLHYLLVIKKAVILHTSVITVVHAIGYITTHKYNLIQWASIKKFILGRTIREAPKGRGLGRVRLPQYGGRGPDFFEIYKQMRNFGAF